MTGRPIRPGHGEKKENEARAKAGLPADVQLVFYPEPTDESSKMDILRWDILEEKENMTLLEIVTVEKTYRIQAGIVSFMQEEDFIKQNTRPLWR